MRPEIKTWPEVIMENGSMDGWVGLVCPFCNWHDVRAVRLDTLSPAYLFDCARPDNTCSGKWSIALVQAAE